MKPPSLKKERWVGIDPGFLGALGVIDGRGRFVSVDPMPVTGEAGRDREFDVGLLAATITSMRWFPGKMRVLLEWPQTRPDESAESSKRFGVGLGLCEGMWAMAGITVERIAPNLWKGALGLAGKKQDPLAARQQAVDQCRRLIPGVPEEALVGPRGGLKDGAAEALLLAWWGLTRTLDGLRNQPEDVRMARLLFGSKRRRPKVAG